MLENIKKVTALVKVHLHSILNTVIRIYTVIE